MIGIYFGQISSREETAHKVYKLIAYQENPMRLNEAISLLKSNIHKQLGPFDADMHNDSSRLELVYRTAGKTQRFIVLNKALEPLLFSVQGADGSSITTEAFNTADHVSNNWIKGYLAMTFVPERNILNLMYRTGFLYKSPLEVH